MRTKPPWADAAITEASELTVLRNDILAYIRSTWPERERDVQAARNPPH